MFPDLTKEEKGAIKMNNINSIFKEQTNSCRGQLLFDDELKYRMMIELTNEGVWILDSNSKTVYVNERMTDMLGYTKEEMIGQSLFYFIEPELIDKANKNIECRKNGISEELEFNV